MTAARPGPLVESLPVLGAGLILLGVAVGLLLVGGAVAIGRPVVFDFWLLGTGLVVLLGAMVAILLRPAARPAAPRAASAAPRSARAAPPGPAPEAEAPVDLPETPAPFASVGPQEEPEPLEAPPAAPAALPLPLLTSTIAGQDPGAGGVPDPAARAPVDWEDPGVGGAALPFSPALSAGAGPVGPVGPSGGDAVLEVEVGRLRERIRELEAARLASPPAAPVPLGSRPVPGPLPGSADPSSARRRCSSCATDLAPSLTGPLCWGCGRPLCSACYWQVQAGSRAHRCPACVGRSASAPDTSVSGGRGAEA